MKFVLEAQLLVPMSAAQARPNDAARYARLAMVAIEIAIIARCLVGFDRTRPRDSSR